MESTRSAPARVRARTGKYRPPLASGGPKSAGLTSGTTAERLTPLPRASRYGAVSALIQSGLRSNVPGAGRKVQAAQAISILLPLVSVASAFSEVICPGDTSGGSALIARTRRPWTKDALVNEGLHAASWHRPKMAIRFTARLAPRKPAETATLREAASG